MRDKFHYNEYYKFTGIFWLEHDFENKFSGCVEYVPEIGIKVSLIYTLKNNFSQLEKLYHCGIKKIYGSVECDGKLLDITLLNVVLSYNKSLSKSDLTVIKLSGEAKFLITNIHLRDERISRFDVLYNYNYKSLFFIEISPENINEVSSYTEKHIQLKDETISLNIIQSWKPILSSDYFDNLICVNYFKEQPEKSMEVKEKINQMLRENHASIGEVNEMYSVMSFALKDGKIENYIKSENKWGSFFELLLDQPISKMCSWLIIQRKGYSSNCSLLFKQNYISNKHEEGKKRILFAHAFLPITVDSFKGEKNLSRIQDVYEKWYSYHDNQIWYMVLTGLKSIIYKKNNTNLDDFIMLIAYIETVQNLLDKEKDNIDFLIDGYADEEWKRAVKGLFVCFPPHNTLGQNIKSLRDVISHSAKINKKKGVYLKAVCDSILMQKLYAYLSALFIKMVLMNLYNFDEKSIKNYINKFINIRCNFKEEVYYDRVEDYLAVQQKIIETHIQNASTPHPTTHQTHPQQNEQV